MEWIGFIGLFLGIIAIIWLSFKGLNIAIGAPLATIVVLLTNNMNLLSGMIGPENSYVAELGQFIINTFGLFLLGAVLAQYMEKSHASQAIANFILERIGLDKPYIVMIALLAVAAILTYGGISIFVVIFALIPIARPIFKQMDLNWELVRMPLVIGASTFTLTMLPGAPSVSNAIPAQVMGTGLNAAPVVSILATVAALIFGLIYMRYFLNKSLANNETFYSYLEKDAELKANTVVEEETAAKEAVMPSFGIAVLPLVVLIAINLIWGDVPNIIYISLTTGVLLSALLYRPYIDSHIQALNKAAAGSATSILNTSSAVAFGTMVVGTSGFAVVQSFMSRLISDPLVNLAIFSAVLSGITGSSSGTVGIAVSQLVPDVIVAGYHPELVHRIVSVGSGVLTAVPFSGVIITFQNLAGFSYKTGYRHSLTLVMGMHIIALIVLLLLGPVFY